MPRKEFEAFTRLDASDVNDFLMDQTIMVFGGTAARGSAIATPTEGMYTHLNDTDSLEYWSGSAWEGVGGAGILQVVQTVKTDTFTTSSDSFVEVTGMSASITPSSTSSKVLILAQIAYSLGAGSAGNGGFKITRGGTDIYRGDADGTRTQAVFGGWSASSMNVSLLSDSINYLDSPATSSEVTYQLEAKRMQSGTARVNYVSGDGSDAARVVRGASSITLMEVAG
jgi:hypothetical protein